MKVWESRRFERGLYVTGPVAWTQIAATHKFVIVGANKGIYTDKKFFERMGRAKAVKLERHILYRLTDSANQAQIIRPYVEFTYPEKKLWLDATGLGQHANEIVDEVYSGCYKFDVVPGFRVHIDMLDSLKLSPKTPLWIVSKEEPDRFDIWEYDEGRVWFGYGKSLVRTFKS